MKSLYITVDYVKQKGIYPVYFRSRFRIIEINLEIFNLLHFSTNSIFSNSLTLLF